ncbi:DUF2059 domain-containing protein [Marinobacter halodurans]|uniref:DUF2059 domain-containing protein n=1 Tax=Marinobacter halodurans TaxID=2528979 RepID=A0ABY1ZRE3_9GAMM|nr:DUF2059 domain-containing protein [Marinobacter halodurans]TBW58751.1 DUF2059 domain-containing protein [Marinobacter halodurans]
MRSIPSPDVFAPLRRLALMALVLASSLADASPLSESVVSESPLDEIIDQYPAMMSEGIREGLKQTGQVDPMVADMVGGIVSRAFGSAAIRQQVVTDLADKLSDHQLEAVRDWYRTPLGRRIAQAEVDASRPAAWKTIEAQSSSLVAKYKDTERADLFSRFDRVSRATESTVDTAVAVQLGLASAMSAVSGKQGPTLEQMKQQIEDQRFMLRGAVEQQVYAAYLYTYESFSTDEIEQYLDFLETDAGAAYNRVVTNSIQQAILKPVESVGNQLVRLLNPNATGS